MTPPPPDIIQALSDADDDDSFEYETLSDGSTVSLDTREQLQRILELSTNDFNPYPAAELEVEDLERLGQRTQAVYYDNGQGTFQDEHGRVIEVNRSALTIEDDPSDDDSEGGQTPRPLQQAPPVRRPRIMLRTPEQVLEYIIQGNMGASPRSQNIAAQMLAETTRSRAPYGSLPDDDEEAELDDDDDGYDADLDPVVVARRRWTRHTFAGRRYPEIPSKAGQELMRSGDFGTPDQAPQTARGLPLSEAAMQKRRKLASRLMEREMGLSGQDPCRAARTITALCTQGFLPSDRADLIINFNDRCYSGQFSDDGSFYFACGQDFKIRLYNTSNALDWEYHKTVTMPGGQWTITDACLSPDNKLIASSSIQPQVYIANTAQNATSAPRHIDFSDTGNGPQRGAYFGIWSLRFGGDGRELVAGASDRCIYVYDLEANRSIVRIQGHTDHVNAVCYGDKLSPHLLYSGSDDTTLKVWDRRSLADGRPAGMFLGHTEGLTYIDSKGDGRYVISNGKDQTCKLWDVRKMIQTEDGERVNLKAFTTDFDYRYTEYDKSSHLPHPHDCSVVTFQGHRVLRTLIRCHFSPAGSTDGRYIYSGSHDGKVYIWNVDGTTAATINVNDAVRGIGEASDRPNAGDRDWKAIVRDCSWHPTAPVMTATSWNGWDHGQGACTVHSWNDDADSDEHEPEPSEPNGRSRAHARAANLGSAPMGARVDACLRHDDRYYNPVPLRDMPGRQARLSSSMGLGAMFVDDEGNPDYTEDPTD